MSWAAIASSGVAQTDDDDQQQPVAFASAESQVETFDVDVSLVDAMEKLWELDENRLEPGVHYKLDLQGYTHYHGDGDYARRPLFEFVDEQVFEQRETYKRFRALLDNFERETGKRETFEEDEKVEIEQFLEAVLDTKPMQFCHQYLAHKGKCGGDKDDMKALLYQLWFKMYASTRGGPNDSSGFEHVFVGEEKDHSNEITGLHNWVQLSLEEKKGNLDYKGYISRNRTRPDEDGHILTMQFTWRDAEDGSVDKKPMSTSFIGVSPEFELALYTMASVAPCEEATEDFRGKLITEATFEEVCVKVSLVVWGSETYPKIRTAFPEESRE